MMIWMHGTRVNTAYLHKNVALFYPFMMRNRVGHKTSQISPKKPRHISAVEGVYCTYPSERLNVLDEDPDLGAGCARLRGRRF